MGINIAAINKAKFVVCDQKSDCWSEERADGQPRHHLYSAHKREGLKSGCYVIGDGGERYAFDINYGGFHEFRTELCRFGVGVELEEFWRCPRRYRDKPFFELLNGHDGGGQEFGPKTSAKLYADFAANDARAIKQFMRPRRLEERIADVLRVRPPRKPHTAGAARALRIGDDEESYAKSPGFALVQGMCRSLGAEICRPGSSADLCWMDEIYLDFLCAFDVARDGGFVVYD